MAGKKLTMGEGDLLLSEILEITFWSLDFDDIPRSPQDNEDPMLGLYIIFIHLSQVNHKLICTVSDTVKQACRHHRITKSH